MLDGIIDFFTRQPYEAGVVTFVFFFLLYLMTKNVGGRPKAEAPGRESESDAPTIAKERPSMTETGAGAPVAPPRPAHSEAPRPAPMRERAPAPMPARAERMERPERGPVAMEAPAMEGEAAPIGAEREDHYVVTVHYGTDRADAGALAKPDERFTNARAPRGGSPITYGTCEVSIPKIHKIGELEAPGWFRSEQPGQHIMLLSLGTSDRATFLSNLDNAMGDEKKAFVFVHGFSVSFEDAARRTAQMAFDMKFSGAPIMFDWPTAGLTEMGVNAYTESENNSRWATEHFRAFLLDVVRETGAKTVHLIAHSMGNRIVTDALMQLYWILTDEEKEVLGEVILTAPDIDADVFIDQIAPRITAMNSRVTLYTSTKDTALATSKGVHGYPRAGDFAALAILPAKVEVIDASEVDTDMLGHSYYGNAHSVLSDMCHLITGRVPALSRTITLSTAASARGEPFWRVKKDSTLEQVWAALTGDGRTGVA
ncbi:MAG: alpha/beta fold hydrolase [Rhizobiales bacterium]|nr:alpha/beta fold hydrolase [Hyphomicrobiales bacterium]